MAVGPEMLDASFNEEVKNFEAYFDQKITSMASIYAGKDSLSIDIPAGRGFSYKHYMILRDIYQDAGWNEIDYVSDPRDGHYLKFIS
jgi:hypothetical protein